MSEDVAHLPLLHPKRDKVMRHILLDHLRRDLMYVKFDELELTQLQPLRDEVDALKWALYLRKGNLVDSVRSQA